MKQHHLIIGVLTSLVIAVPSAQGTSITFDFNSLSDGASNTTVQSNMRNTITAALGAGSVNVTGAKAEKNYSGDRHVVGPVSGTTVTSETLGTSDLGVHHNGGFDAFLINSGSDRITMTFSFKIYSVSFDYEIFPDATCPTGVNCGANWPDFKFEADDVLQFTKLAVPPSMLPYTHSPFSGAVNVEKAPQYLGQSGQYLFANGVTKLEFIDWPRLIGIDNLVIDNVRVPGGGTSVPIPGTLLLFVSGLIAAVIAERLGKSTTSTLP